LLGNAGEGDRDVFDQDPLWRLDVFDCTTFVETVLAASLATDRAGFERELFDIRYHDGRVRYLSRNHFPETDWIPNN
ncbi:N-acetylmuramoyl-L-alanine amidase-like domain-containing protein, partial [Acinetobacter baumannii]